MRRNGTPRRGLVLVAHYDHLGIGSPDTSGDSIYNGFSDNGIGVAMLFGIAEALLEDPLGRSVIFLFPVAEELGLLGSGYYVSHPAFPLERTHGVIALDAGAPPAPPTSWELAGADSAVDAAARAVGSRYGWTIRISHARPNSDYFPFVRRGIPGFLIIPGRAPYDGLTEAESRTLQERWDYYHQPGDEYRDGFPMSGVVRYAEFTLQTALEYSRMRPRVARTGKEPKGAERAGSIFRKWVVVLRIKMKRDINHKSI